MRHGGAPPGTSHLTHDRQTTVHSGAHAQASRRVELLYRGHDLECGSQCLCGIVVVGLGPPETEADAVAAVTFDVTGETSGHRYRMLLVRLNQLGELLGVDGGGQLG